MMAMVMLFVAVLSYTDIIIRVDDVGGNDSIYYFEKNTHMPEEITFFSTEQRPPSDITPAVYKLKAPSGKYMYMVGTMHALHKYDYPLPTILQTAYKECDAVAVEIENVNQDPFAETYTPDPMLSNGDTLKNHLKDDQYEAVKAYFESDRLSEAARIISDFNAYAPWYVYSLIPTIDTDLSVFSSTYGLDRILQIQSNIDEKEVISIETDKAKQTRYSSMPEEIVGILLKYAALASEDDNLAELEESYKAWSSGDMDKVYEIASSLDKYTDEEKKIMEEYNKIMLDDRNELMADRAIELLNGDKQVLFAVGAGHFGGEKGIVALLQNKGYTVERVQ